MASDIITNEAFLKIYDDLKLSIINQKRNTKNLTWDQIVQIFTQLKVDFCDVPNDKVRTRDKQSITKSSPGFEKLSSALLPMYKKEIFKK